MQLLQQEIFMVRCSENIMVSQYHTIILIILSVKWPLQKWKQKGFSNKCFILSQNIRHETWNIFLITLIRETVIVRSRILPDQIWWLNRIWTWTNWLDQLRPLCSFSVTASVCGDLPSLFLSVLTLGLIGVEGGLWGRTSLPVNGLLYWRLPSKSAM